MSDFPLFNAQGAFLGMALGDAYGRTLEHKRGSSVRNHRVNIDANQFNWTDETQMALYLSDAILSVGNDQFTPERFASAVAHQFSLWANDPITPHMSPDENCLAASRKYNETRNWKTCGIARSDTSISIARICPIALYFSGVRLEQAAELSVAVTHQHPNAIGAGVATARLVATILSTSNFTEGTVLEQSHLIRQSHPDATEVPMAMEAGILLSRKPHLDWLDESAIPPGDGGWRAPSALGLAIAAALKWKNDMAEALDKAARINGDSDGVAALTGMFLGALHGIDGLPVGWLQALPMAKDIAKKAESLWGQTSTSTRGYGGVTAKIHNLHQLGAYFRIDSNIQLGLIQIHASQTNAQQIIALRELANAIGEHLHEGIGSMYVPVDPSLVPSELRKIAAQNTNPTETEGEAYVEDETETDLYEDAEVVVEEQPFQTKYTQSYSGDRPNESPTTRTSISDPIIVNWVEEGIGSTNGKVGITFAPGKKSESKQGSDWNRDLQLDLDRLRAFYGVDVLISLIEDDEIEQLQITDLVAQGSNRRIAVIRSPIKDGDIPSRLQAMHLVITAKAIAKAGQKVVFHCKGGLGRAGTLCACTLIALGQSAQQAVSLTRQRRAGAIENKLQEEFIAQFELDWNRP